MENLSLKLPTFNFYTKPKIQEEYKICRWQISSICFYEQKQSTPAKDFLRKLFFLRPRNLISLNTHPVPKSKPSTFSTSRWAGPWEREVQGHLRRAGPDLRRNVRILKSSTTTTTTSINSVNNKFKTIKLGCLSKRPAGDVCYYYYHHYFLI